MLFGQVSEVIAKVNVTVTVTVTVTVIVIVIVIAKNRYPKGLGHTGYCSGSYRVWDALATGRACAALPRK